MTSCLHVYDKKIKYNETYHVTKCNYRVII